MLSARTLQTCCSVVRISLLNRPSQDSGSVVVVCLSLTLSLLHHHNLSSFPVDIRFYLYVYCIAESSMFLQVVFDRFRSIYTKSIELAHTSVYAVVSRLGRFLIHNCSREA